MFSAIIGAVVNLWGWLRTFFSDLWKQIVGFVTSFWGVVLLAASWVWTVLHWGVQAVTKIGATLTNLAFPQYGHGSPVMEQLAFVNTVLPLQELFGFVVAYVALVVVLSIYRLVKSWVPTVSG